MSRNGPTDTLVFQHFFLQINFFYKILRSGKTSCSLHGALGVNL